MFPSEHRTKGAAVVGAAAPGEQGPFGTWPTDADDRVRALIRAAADKRATAKRKRALRAVARQHGLVSRHAAKLARSQQTDTEPDDSPPEVAADDRP
jgi:hypothetical protein